MTQTLTTKVLNDFITGQGYGVAPSAVEAMARELLANREAQPVAEIRAMPVGNGWKRQAIYWFGKQDCDLPVGTKLYTAPPAPAVNIAPDFEAWFNSPEAGFRVVNFHIQHELQLKAWNACRAAMLAAAPEGGN